MVEAGRTLIPSMEARAMRINLEDTEVGGFNFELLRVLSSQASDESAVV